DRTGGTLREILARLAQDVMGTLRLVGAGTKQQSPVILPQAGHVPGVVALAQQGQRALDQAKRLMELAAILRGDSGVPVNGRPSCSAADFFGVLDETLRELTRVD